MGEQGAKLTQQASDVCNETVQMLLPLGDISRRKMFGGYGIFASAKMFALVTSAGKLHLKVDAANRQRFEEVGAPRHGKMPYFEVPQKVFENASVLKQWAKESIQIAHSGNKK